MLFHELEEVFNTFHEHKSIASDENSFWETMVVVMSQIMLPVPVAVYR